MLRYSTMVTGYWLLVTLQPASFTLQNVFYFNQREVSSGIHMHAKAGMYLGSII